MSHLPTARSRYVKLKSLKVVSRGFCPFSTLNANKATLLFAVIAIKCYFVCTDCVDLLGLCMFCSFLFPWNSYLLRTDGSDQITVHRGRKLKWIVTIRIRAHSTFSVSALPKKPPTGTLSLVNTIRKAHLFVIWDSRTLCWLNIYFCEMKSRRKKTKNKTWWAITNAVCSSTLLSTGGEASTAAGPLGRKWINK